MFDAINGAEKLICLTGWSFCTDTRLVRGEDAPDGVDALSLGELLVKKAEEGVEVLVMTWNEAATWRDGIHLPGQMGPHDEQTAEYFRTTGVKCANIPRRRKKWQWLGNSDLFVSLVYSHHQKTVIVDAAMPEGSGGEGRRLVAFVGGLDTVSYTHLTLPTKA